MQQQKWDGKSYGTPLGYKIFIYSLRLFGLRFAYGLLFFVCCYYYMFRPKSRRSTAQLRKIYENWEQSDKQKLGLFFPFKRIFVFGQVLIDRVAVFFGIKFHLEAHGTDYLESLEKSGGIILGSHLGNWEAGLSILKDKKDIHTHVAMSVVAGDFLQKMLRQKADNFVSIISLDAQHDSLFQIKNRLQEDKIVAMHGDRYFGKMRTSVGEFLGKDAHFPVGPYILSATLGKKICFVSVVKTKWNAYKVVCSEPLQCVWDKKYTREEQLKSWLQKYIDFTEKNLVKYPEQWFNFYDFWAQK
ncbi:LpxL/LpxP family acyltransferase [Candidatus Uabimicrobium amorphum]|uniref:Lipid A biosynthesis acyltransferase n=1 Tax=Uabimicrobium amorphum TaxID=2596890 RepID=A0A5S9IPD6_UABAM|nr:lysophospholipid acyltransferase family protein [Candidatus Uabimicrobium amorphum]BBM85166.1 lipid A biosynthesis acyltransferase [Candidatus Uabimicrobium amorphum]